MSRYSRYSGTSTSQATEDSKRKSLLKDGSWIRRPEEEDEAVDRDPNFGKSILGQYRSTESIGSSGSDDLKPTSPTSVQALSRRFTGSTDDLKSPTESRTSSTYTRSSKTTTVTNDAKVSETTITTTQSLRSPGIKSPTKTETFSERVQSSSRGQQFAYSPTRTTRVSETTTTSDKTAEDKLYSSLIPSAIKDGRSSTRTETYSVKSSSNRDDDTPFDSNLNKSSWDGDSKISTETVTVTRSTNGDSFKSTTSTRRPSTAEDELYDSLLPRAISNIVESPPSPPSTQTSSSYSSYKEDLPTTRTSSTTISSKPGSLVDDYSSEHKSYSYSRPSSTYEYSSITTPTDYSSLSSTTEYTSTTYRSRSTADDTDSGYTKSTTNNSLYSQRPVLEKDLCTTCRKPFTGDAKMILDDVKINCHATCFKCEVCSHSLAHLKAGDSMWVYNRLVHCEPCFESIRDKWRR